MLMTEASANSSTQMHAVVQEEYGPADVFRTAEVPKPELAPNEVLMHVRAAGMDRGTWHLMAGKPYLIRLMGFGLRRPKNRVPGLDVAGTVVAVGTEVTMFQPGDEVFGIARGSFAEYAAALESKLALKPANLTFEQAAVVPISGGTAIQAVRHAGRVAAGQKVLVIGASGGVGSYAAQIAKALGAHVTGVSSSSKVEMVRSIGADRVIDYESEDFAADGRRFDVIVDTGGNSGLSRLRRALNPHGTLVIVGGERGGSVLGGFDRQIRAGIWSLFLRQRLISLMSKEDRAFLEELRPLLESGQVKPVVDRVFPLDEVPDAMRRLEAGEVRGKLAIRV
jgi:NADPH:quinone reductase-like Zn-dependent oxidoreductase